MAHKITIIKILPGVHRSQFHIYLLSDGASPELTDQVLIDPVTDLGIPSSSRLAIERITYSFTGFSSRIEFDTGLVDDKMIWVLPEKANEPIDFSPWGGLKDQSGLDGTGKIQITTNGLTNSGSEGSILIMVRND